MKTSGLKVCKKIFATFVCIILLLSNVMLFLPVDNENCESKYISCEKEIEKQEVVALVERETASSRSGIREVEKIEYKIYKLTIDNKIEFLFEDLNLAENKKDYILNNTNSNVILEEIIQDNKDNLSDINEVNRIISNIVEEYKESLTCYPTISHYISSKYGNRSRGDFHTGIDLAGKYGDKIFSYKKGTVIFVQYSNKSYGNMVLIEHSNGMKTRYAHMSSIAVKKGDKLDCGDLVGYMGSTGNSTGNHLHFEIIINEKTVNPYNYIF